MARVRTDVEQLLLSEMVVEDLNDTLIESDILDDVITPTNTIGIFDDTSSYDGLYDGPEEPLNDDYEDEDLF